MSRNLRNRTGDLTRRGFVAGTAAVAAGGVTASMFSSSAAQAAKLITPVAPTNMPHDLFAHHCSLVHKAMSEKLTAMVADPLVSKEETSLALRSTFCPCCNTQISATYPATPIHSEFTADARAKIYKEAVYGQA